MSDQISVRINCFHSGVFKVEEDDELNYVDGLLEVFEVGGASIFEDVTKVVVEKGITGKMWYKLPYEDISDRLPLFDNADENRRRMNANGRWYRVLDVFVERVESEKAGGSRIQGAGLNMVRLTDRDIEAEEEGDHEDETYDGDHEAEEEGDHEAEDDGDPEADHDGNPEAEESDESEKEDEIDIDFEEDL